ncbi:circularly permuted type 2 ATP-grasp protein [Aquipuribacter sp. SD81]|uniref:circularly permuted type 2 ATP-grasp protein n=1 Tax=Aquipuribacter sp. SD81 TaxID=3127703 RepID=UPI003018D503
MQEASPDTTAPAPAAPTSDEGDVFAGYLDKRTAGPAWDEVLAPHGVRPAARAVHRAVSALSVDELRARSDALASTFLDRGVTFDFAGEERPFPIDVVPRVIAAHEWAQVERGVKQRVQVLERFLADVYGPMNAVSDGVVPRSVVVSSSHFHREAAGIEPANGVRVHVSGIDLVRDEQGRFRVLEDNVRVPSGVSYVLENRRAMTQVLPDLFGASRVRPVSDYPERLLAALQAAAPPGVDDPTVVVLTPGVYNSAYFEHALLARSMGVELVEGRDLVCSGNRVRMLTTSGERRVDVVYRRVDDEYLDPVQFRRDSVLGCAGLLNAARAGSVTIANAVGNGVADDKLLYTYLPDLTRYYLGEDPVLDNVDTWRCDDPAHLEEVLDRLDELVVKPVDGSGGKGIVIGPQATTTQLDAMRERLSSDPRGWIAQPVVSLSTVPTLVGDELAPRHVDLRPFAVNDGEDVWVLPGGLTRVALGEATLVVNSSQGGGSKDTWVLSDRTDRTDRIAERGAAAELPERGTTELELVRSAPPDSGPAGDDQGRQAEQQQQVRRPTC